MLHEESDKPNVQIVNSQQINHLFGAKRDVKVNANGLVCITMNHIKHYYLIEDYDVIESHSKVCVSYDPEDMETVEVYKRVKDSTWLIRLCTAKQFTPVQVYGPQAEFNRLQEMKQHQRNIEEKRKEKLEEKLEAIPEEENMFKYEAEEELMMGMHTMKKAAGGYEDIELGNNKITSAEQSIYKQLYNN